MAIAHAKGIAAAADLKEKVQPNQPGKKHYLMTGTFNSKAEAENHAEKLREQYGWLIYVKES